MDTEVAVRTGNDSNTSNDPQIAKSIGPVTLYLRNLLQKLLMRNAECLQARVEVKAWYISILRSEYNGMMERLIGSVPDLVTRSATHMDQSLLSEESDPFLTRD
jgi:hypothetical protein